MTAEPSVSVTQPELFPLSEVDGYGALSLRERRFVEGLMQGQNRTEAARSAGVTGCEENVRTAGSRLAGKPRVAAVLAQAWRRSGADIERTVAQAAEIAERAAEKLREATAPKDRAQALREWNHAATLLASIHGKLKIGIELSGAVAHGISPVDFQHLEELNRGLMQREAVEVSTQRITGD